jgi:nucleoside-diphosphate-sugar epimerase
MRILITGAAGRLGQRLAKRLEADHALVLGDLKRISDPRFVRTDITDLEAVRAAMQGCNAVVHMAIMDWPSCGPKEELRYGVPSVQVHVAGLHNVLQAAVEAGVRRFVYTSSVSVVDGLPANTRADSDTRHYSNEIYGLTKVPGAMTILGV